jgi:hypothetical protein
LRKYDLYSRKRGNAYFDTPLPSKTFLKGGTGVNHLTEVYGEGGTDLEAVAKRLLLHHYNLQSIYSLV